MLVMIAQGKKVGGKREEGKQQAWRTNLGQSRMPCRVRSQLSLKALNPMLLFRSATGASHTNHPPINTRPAGSGPLFSSQYETGPLRARPCEIRGATMKRSISRPAPNNVPDQRHPQIAMCALPRRSPTCYIHSTRNAGRSLSSTFIST